MDADATKEGSLRKVATFIRDPWLRNVATSICHIQYCSTANRVMIEKDRQHEAAKRTA